VISQWPVKKKLIVLTAVGIIDGIGGIVWGLTIGAHVRRPSRPLTGLYKSHIDPAPLFRLHEMTSATSVRDAESFPGIDHHDESKEWVEKCTGRRGPICNLGQGRLRRPAQCQIISKRMAAFGHFCLLVDIWLPPVEGTGRGKPTGLQPSQRHTIGLRPMTNRRRPQRWRCRCHGYQ
jgi:hypothetical protein